MRMLLSGKHFLILLNATEVLRFRYQHKIVNIFLSTFSYLPTLTDVLGAQKNRLIETVLLSTHNIFLVEK